MDTDTIRRDLDTFHKTVDRFTPLMVFACDHDFPAFAAENDIHYKSVMGLYQGVIEDSFAVAGADAGPIAEAGLLKGQETVLLLFPQEAVYGGQRPVYLAKVLAGGFLGDHPAYIGQWYKVSTSEALHSDAWTCYPEDNTWYVAKMPETEV